MSGVLVDEVEVLLVEESVVVVVTDEPGTVGSVV